jgi:hypothetical protein
MEFIKGGAYDGREKGKRRLRPRFSARNLETQSAPDQCGQNRIFSEVRAFADDELD